MMHPAGTPIIATTTTEKDVDTECTCVLDMNSFAIPSKDATEKEVKKWRRDMMKYVEHHLDLVISGSANEFRFESRTA
jgi:hypothetical protein